MKRNTSFKLSRHLSGSIFGNMRVCVKSHPSTRGRSRKIVLLLIFKLPAEKHVYLGDLSDMHMAEQMTQSLDKT